ncbi:hypothetical protein BY996DRAFT_4598393, partial [Phakopsora pachyrhizi]
KQVTMFSATLSKDIRPICKKFMQNPLEIYVDDEAKLTLHGLQQHFVKINEAAKNRKLNDLLDTLEFNQVCIFVKSVSRAVQLDQLLRDCNFPSIAIHLGLGQEEQINHYKQFKLGFFLGGWGRGFKINPLHLKGRKQRQKHPRRREKK